MLHYRLLFRSKKSFMRAAIGVLILSPISIILMVMTASPQLTLFNTVGILLNCVLCVGLISAWKKEDMIRISGLIAGILLVELCHYTYLLEMNLSIGVDIIVSMGLARCMILSTYLMIFFIIQMLTYNHFTIFFGKRSGRTKLIVNQFSLCILLLCFVMLIVENWLFDGNLFHQAVDAVGYLSDLCLFTAVACCELHLAVNSGAVQPIAESENDHEKE